jgi:predicted nucleic acid-binding protein
VSELVLLDTCVIINLENVELADLAYGLDTDDLIERYAFTDRCYAVLDFAVPPFDSSAATLYGTLASLIRRTGRNPRPRPMDVQIAATAAAHSLPLVTRHDANFVELDRLLKVIVV